MSHPDSYLTRLLAVAPDDVATRLAELGDLVLDDEHLPVLRTRQLRAPGAPNGRVDHLDLTAPGPVGAPDVPVRLHREKGEHERQPCLLSLHGGGYVIGSHLGDDGRFDRWAPELGCVGISVGYRLAPEHPYPEPLDDCYAALRWAWENAAALGIDPDRIGIIGGSAGGGLAAGLALLARDRAEIPVAFQVLSYPMLDNRPSTRSRRVAAPLWGPASNAYGWAAYLRAADAENPPPYAVPGRAADLTRLPPTFVTVGNLDGLLDESLCYAARLIHAGVPTDLHVLADGPHAFDSMLPATAVARRARSAMEAWLEVHLRG